MVESFEEKLIELISSFPGMERRETRNLLLANFPEDPISLISRDDALRQDLTCIVNFASKMGRVSDTGKFVVETLITNAKTLVKGLEKENQLNTLLYEFQKEKQSEIDFRNPQISQSHTEILIPFVIVSMTLDEAKELKCKLDSVNGGLESELNAFQELIESLKPHGVTEFTECYGSSRDDWKPYTCLGKTIKEIISEITDEINEYNKEQGTALPIIQPKFFSDDCFELESNKRINNWNELKQKGCVIIVDPISLFYPFVRDKFLSAETGSHENVSILTLSPVNPCMVEVNKILEKLVSNQMEQAFFRFHQHLDKRCEIGIGDLRSIKRWLFSILPETIEILSKQKAQPQNRKILQEVVGAPNRLDRLWRGGDV